MPNISAYLDHAATTPLLAEAQAALIEGFALWANPSSPHASGRAARAALEAGPAWLAEAQRLRSLLEGAIISGGGEVIAGGSERIAAIGAYRMPGVSSASQLIRFDAMGIAVSAGSACSSGSLKVSHVLGAMGMDEKAASEVIRVSIGRETDEVDIRRFIDAWLTIAGSGRHAR